MFSFTQSVFSFCFLNLFWCCLCGLVSLVRNVVTLLFYSECDNCHVRNYVEVSLVCMFGLLEL